MIIREIAANQPSPINEHNIVWYQADVSSGHRIIWQCIHVPNVPCSIYIQRHLYDEYTPIFPTPSIQSLQIATPIQTTPNLFHFGPFRKTYQVLWLNHDQWSINWMKITKMMMTQVNVLGDDDDDDDDDEIGGQCIG